MEHGDFLIYVLVFLAAAVVVIPVFRHFGLSAVSGYLAAGIMIGPSGFGLIHETQGVMNMAELGVVFLLFVIGLELKPSRLWTMRKNMIGSGGTQIIICCLVIFLALNLMNVGVIEALVISFAVSLSSTALVLQLLSEQNQLNAYHGRQAFSVLLFQDIAVIPVMAILPFFTTSEAKFKSPGLSALVVLFLIIIGFHFFSRPVLRWVAKAKSRDMFTSIALFLVMSVGVAMHTVHLSMELGAFLAGVMLSGSEYRHQLESDIEPFKGLLLGLFFMGIGMGLEAEVMMSHWPMIIGSTIGLILIKTMIIYWIGRFNELSKLSSLKFGIVLSQGGEFAFVLIGIATTLGLVTTTMAGLVIPVVTFSMLCTPFLFAIILKVATKKPLPIHKEFDAIDDHHPQILVAGLGRFGQIPARILRNLDIPFTALEHDPGQVEVLRSFGNLVYYGDGTRLDLLQNAGAHNAKVFLVAIAEYSTSVKIVRLAKKHFPHLIIVARARNRQHAFDLLDAGADHAIRETFASALEATDIMLQNSGLDAERVARIISSFRTHDEELLKEQYQNTGEQPKVALKSTKRLRDILEQDNAAEHENETD